MVHVLTIGTLLKPITLERKRCFNNCLLVVSYIDGCRVVNLFLREKIQENISNSY